MIIKDLRELNGVKNKHWMIQCNDVFLYVDSVMSNGEVCTAYKNTLTNDSEIVKDLEKFGFDIALYEPIIVEVYEGDTRVMQYNYTTNRARISSTDIFDLWIKCHEDMEELLEEIEKESRYVIYRK